MTILEFADVIGQNLRIIYYSNQDVRFCASFEHGEVKDGGCLIGAHENATNPTAAINKYANRIAGETIVFYAMHADLRKEFVAPKTFDMIGG